MKREPHQGYTNYETFSIAVVIDNDQKELGIARTIARLAYDTTESGRDPECVAADALKDYYEDRMPEDLPLFYGSLLRAGWAEVDWLELAREWLKDDE